MFILSAAGAAMIATSAIGLHRNMPNNHLKIIVRKYLEANKLDGVRVTRVHRRSTHVYSMELLLPYNMTADKIQDHVPGFEQVTSSHVHFVYSGGPRCRLDFGFSQFKANMPFNRLEPLQPLRIPLYSPFGTRYIDFNEETSCHMLLGGATRMGKTALLRLIATLLITGTKGNIRLKLIDNKVNDVHMFQNIPQVDIAETQEEAYESLMEAVRESEMRKNLLKQHNDCIDMKEFRQKHSDEASAYPPYFVVIDEYGRFADNPDIQKCVERLVETAGYVDMHILIASQRPDAQTVLKARIKANLTTRVCFTTMDEANSKVVLDIPDAYRLGKVQGRAVLLDGFPEVVQVPFLSTLDSKDMLRPYVKERESNDSKRRDVVESFEPLQGFEPLSSGEDDLPKPKKRNANSKSRSKKA